MEVKESITDVREKMFNRLVGTGWETYLRIMVRSTSFDDILNKLKKEVENDYRFTPPLNDIFKPFELCHTKDLKVVFLVKEPYLYIKKADGLCFSTAYESKPHNAQQHIFQEIARSYPDKNYTHGNDMSDWAKQGILMYNTCLTTRIAEIGKHYHIWRVFTRFVIEKINAQHPDIIYILFGDTYDLYDKLIPSSCHKLYVSCPTDVSFFNKKMTWKSNNIFIEINNILKQQGKEPINW